MDQGIFKVSSHDSADGILTIVMFLPVKQTRCDAVTLLKRFRDYIAKNRRLFRRNSVPLHAY